MTTTSNLDVVANRLRHRSMGHVLFAVVIAFALAFMLVAFGSSHGLPISHTSTAVSTPSVGAQIQAYTNAACGDDLAPRTMAQHSSTQPPAC